MQQPIVDLPPYFLPMTPPRRRAYFRVLLPVFATTRFGLHHKAPVQPSGPAGENNLDVERGFAPLHCSLLVFHGHIGGWFPVGDNVLPYYARDPLPLAIYPRDE